MIEFLLCYEADFSLPVFGEAKLTTWQVIFDLQQRFCTASSDPSPRNTALEMCYVPCVFRQVLMIGRQQ